MSRWTAAHSAALTRSPVVGVNFHKLSPENRDEAEVQLRESLRLSRPYDPDEPAGGSGPRLLVAFYDSYHDTGLFGADLCHRLGIRAWFFPLFTPRDTERGQLSDAELASIAEVHHLGFHTSSHLEAKRITERNLQAEVVDPVERIRAITGSTPRVGAWRGGARFDEGQLADRTLRDLGVGHLVSNWSVERLPPPPR